MSFLVNFSHQESSAILGHQPTGLLRKYKEKRCSLTVSFDLRKSMFVSLENSKPSQWQAARLHWRLEKMSFYQRVDVKDGGYYLQPFPTGRTFQVNHENFGG